MISNHCKYCGIELTTENIRAKTLARHHYICNACELEKNRKFRKDHPTYEAIRKRKWRKLNPLKSLADMKKWGTITPEYEKRFKAKAAVTTSRLKAKEKINRSYLINLYGKELRPLVLKDPVFEEAIRTNIILKRNLKIIQNGMAKRNK